MRKPGQWQGYDNDSHASQELTWLNKLLPIMLDNLYGTRVLIMWVGNEYLG